MRSSEMVKRVLFSLVARDGICLILLRSLSDTEITTTGPLGLLEKDWFLCSAPVALPERQNNSLATVHEY